MEWIIKGMIAAGLSVNSFLDVKKREISLPIVVMMLVGGMSGRIYSGKLDLFDIIIGLMPGLMAIVITLVGDGCIGYGDIWLLLGMGPVLGGKEMIQICMGALMMAGLFSLILIVVFHRGRKDEIPFAPFLLVSQIGTMIMGGLS